MYCFLDYLNVFDPFNDVHQVIIGFYRFKLLSKEKEYILLLIQKCQKLIVYVSKISPIFSIGSFFSSSAFRDLS